MSNPKSSKFRFGTVLVFNGVEIAIVGKSIEDLKSFHDNCQDMVGHTFNEGRVVEIDITRKNPAKVEKLDKPEKVEVEAPEDILPKSLTHDFGSYDNQYNKYYNSLITNKSEEL